LSSVDLAGLSHQQKLAFWINIYNSCMMNVSCHSTQSSSPTPSESLIPEFSLGHLSVIGKLHFGDSLINLLVPPYQSSL